MSADTQPQERHSAPFLPITATGAQDMNARTQPQRTDGYTDTECASDTARRAQAERAAVTDARYTREADARALARLAPEWTDAQAYTYAALMWDLDGHGAALWYTHGGAEYCKLCAERLCIGVFRPLTMAADAYLSSLDTTREHAAAVCEHAGRVDSIPACDSCRALIDGATLTPDGVSDEKRAYVAVYALAERGKRAGHVPPCAQDDMQLVRRETLAAHGVRMADLERAARIADMVSLARERADGFR